MANAKLDDNRNPSLIGVSSVDLATPVRVAVNPVTGALVTDATVTITGVATEDNQTDGSQKTQVVDGSGNIIGATSNALDINIKSGNPTTITATQSTATNLKTQAENYQGGTAVGSANPLQVSLANTGANATAVAVSAAALPLPSGAATSALQLADGHNVTIDNSTGGSAVNIQDGGNTITVDGTVTANISGSISNTSFASTIADGASVTLGSKADAKSIATDTTAVTIMQVLKEISYMEQNPASRAVTFTGSTDVATQTTLSAINTKLVNGTDIGDVTINNSTGGSAVNIQDGGNTITVDGAVTTSGTVTEASGSAIKTAVEAIDNAVDGNYLNSNLNYAGTDAVTGNGTAAGSLRVSLASDSTGIVSLTTSSASIGKLASNTDVDIGDVDILSIIPGVAATNLGKAEDAAHSSGDVGVMALGVRNDSPDTAVSATAGDYTPISLSSTGAVRLAPMNEDFATLANGTQVKKYYTNAGAVTDGIIWSPAAGKRWYVTDLIINTSAAATITIEDDLAGGDSPIMKFEMAANGGMVSNFNTPLFSGEDAADLIITTSAGNIYVTATGYEI